MTLVRNDECLERRPTGFRLGFRRGHHVAADAQEHEDAAPVRGIEDRGDAIRVGGVHVGEHDGIEVGGHQQVPGNGVRVLGVAHVALDIVGDRKERFGAIGRGIVSGDHGDPIMDAVAGMRARRRGKKGG